MKEEPSQTSGVGSQGWGPWGRPPHNVHQMRVAPGTVLCRGGDHWWCDCTEIPATFPRLARNLALSGPRLRTWVVEGTSPWLQCPDRGTHRQQDTHNSSSFVLVAIPWFLCDPRLATVDQDTLYFLVGHLQRHAPIRGRARFAVQHHPLKSSPVCPLGLGRSALAWARAQIARPRVAVGGWRLASRALLPAAFSLGAVLQWSPRGCYACTGLGRPPLGQATKGLRPGAQARLLVRSRARLLRPGEGRGVLETTHRFSDTRACRAFRRSHHSRLLSLTD